MFSRFTRLPLRRCLHTATPRATSTRFRFTAGASAVVVASYLTWQLASDSHRIALDSATKIPTVKQPNPPSPSPAAPSSETSFVADSIHKDSPLEDKTADTNTSEESADGSAEVTEADESPDSGTGGAFNPVTGEINWDCPCLGGMAHGPCGPEFREAFSCFVFSEDEPKGINCVEKFKGMQTCFREHPEIYGDEIMDDDEDEQPATAVEGAILTSSDQTDPTKHDNTASQDVSSSQPDKSVAQEAHSPASVTP